MSYAQMLVDMANRAYKDSLIAKAHNMHNASVLAIGRRRGIIMALEALGVVPAYDIETGLYHL